MNATTDPVWRSFASKHPRHQFLKCNPLYALPTRLIDLIAGKEDAASVMERQGIAPKFLSKEEIRFERDLSQVVTGGFFYQQPFRCLLLVGDDPSIIERDRQIESMLMEI